MRILLPVLAAAACAADLPVTAVTVLPGGLVVERAGTLPAGDEAIAGLPGWLDEGTVTVEVDGREIDGWRLVRPQPAPARPADPAAQQAQAVAALAQGAARTRAGLAAAAAATESAKPGAPPALPTAEAIRARVAFAAANAGRAVRDAQAAAEAADVAAQALAGAPPPPGERPALRLPAAAAARQVRLRYLVPGAAWSPAWRLEVEGADATLVQLAAVELRTGEGLPSAALAVATRGRADAALLADPAVRILGLRESLELERPPRPTTGKGSEPSVDAGLRRWVQLLATGSGSYAADAVQTLAVLGAGYDHKTPNRYRPAMRAALARLADADPAGLPLGELALAAIALAEAYGMTADPELRPRAESFIAVLRHRWPGELPGLVATPSALGGPFAAALATSALKSAFSSGLEVGADLQRLRDTTLGGGEEAELARLFIRVFTGDRAPLIDVATARRWNAAFARWWDAGRIELIYLAIHVAFQNGGEPWREINGFMRDRLVQLQQPDGGWPLDHHPLGRIYASALATLCLEVYYRYAPVGGNSQPAPTADDAARFGDLVTVAACASLDAAPPPPDWPVRVAAAQPVALVPGRQLIELRRIRLAAAIAWQAVPSESPGVWRRLSAPNPWPSPLPPGPIEVVADGRTLGTGRFAGAAPGAGLELDLGPDDRLRVRRTVRSASDDGMFKRDLTMAVTCRLESPAGWSAPVRVRESLPRPAGEQIACELLRPLRLAGEDYRRRLSTRPLVDAELTAAAPEAVLYELRLTYPRSVRPRLEAR